MNSRAKRGFNYIGAKSGDLTVIGEAEKLTLPSGQKPRRLLCRCSCGVEKPILLLHFLRGRIKSCGCLYKVKDGDSSTKLCRRYKAMIERCHVVPAVNYKQKGIEVCKEWRESYQAYKRWALANGYSDSLQIDRIDNSKGYSPDNCRFVTCAENASNRSLTVCVYYKGVKRPLTTLLREKKKMQHYATIIGRLNRGWQHEKAIDKPIRKLKTPKSDRFNIIKKTQILH